MYTQTAGSSPGNSTFMEEKQEKDITELLQKQSEYISLLKVNTDVMHDAGIDEGDVVAVDRSIAAGNNSIVVALIGTDMVIRQLESTGGKDILVTPGKKLSPLDVTGRLKVWGVVLYVIRKIGC